MKWKGLLSKFLFGVSAFRILKIIISRASYLSRKLSEAYIVLKWSCPESSVVLLFCSFLFFHFGFSLFYFFFSSFSFPSICWASQHPGCVVPLLAGFLTETQYVRWCTTLTFPPTAESWWSQWSLWCTLLLKVSEHAVTVVQSAYHFCFVLISLSLLLGFLFLLSTGMLSDLELVKPYYQHISWFCSLYHKIINLEKFSVLYVLFCASPKQCAFCHLLAY